MVGSAQTEVFALALQFEIGVQAVGDARAVLARGEHHQESPRRQRDLGESPGVWIHGVIAQVPSRQGDVLVGHVLEFDPVLVVPLFIPEGLLVVGHHLRQDHSPGARRRQQRVFDGSRARKPVRDVGQIADVGFGGPGQCGGSPGRFRYREPIDIRAHLADRSGGQTVDAEVGRIDSLNRFDEMDLDLGEAEDEARFGEQRFDRRGDRLGVGQTAAPQEAQQGKAEVNEQTSEGTHREWEQAIGFPSGGEVGDRFLIG